MFNAQVLIGRPVSEHFAVGQVGISYGVAAPHEHGEGDAINKEAGLQHAASDFWKWANKF